MTAKQANSDAFVDRGLAVPTVLGALQELARLVGPQEALAAWTKGAYQADRHGMALTPDEILEVALVLREESGPVKIFAIALQTRCISHRVLNREKGA